MIYAKSQNSERVPERSASRSDKNFGWKFCGIRSRLLFDISPGKRGALSWLFFVNLRLPPLSALGFTNFPTMAFAGKFSSELNQAPRRIENTATIFP